MNFLKNLWAMLKAFVTMKPYTPPSSNPDPVVNRPPVTPAPFVAPTIAPRPMTLDDVHDQESLNAYRMQLLATDRGRLAYTPTVWTEPAPAEHVDQTPKPFPATWDGAPLRQVVDLAAATVYTLHFKGGVGSVTVTPTAADPAGQSAHYQVTVRSNGIPFTYGVPSSHKFVRFDVPSGDCTIDLSSDVTSQAWLQLG